MNHQVNHSEQIRHSSRSKQTNYLFPILCSTTYNVALIENYISLKQIEPLRLRKLKWLISRVIFAIYLWLWTAHFVSLEEKRKKAIYAHCTCVQESACNSAVRFCSKRMRTCYEDTFGHMHASIYLSTIQQ